MTCVLYVFVMCMISLSYWFDTHHFFDRKKAQKKTARKLFSGDILFSCLGI